MSIRTITAIFDSAEDAQRTRQQLLSSGLDEDRVKIVSQESSARSGDDHKGLWESIKDFFVSDEDRHAYDEGVRRGGYLLTARVDEEDTDEALTILEQSDAVDMDQRMEQWRAEGWSGYEDESSSVSQTGGPASAEQTIPVVEERLRVGKREVGRGGVRVRSYIVEEPIHEEVQLREEHVDVQRRPVAQRTVEGAADDLMQDRTIEVSETVEEAVIAKDAVVTEEVIVEKFTGERTEGIDDTVRRTEVDVEDTRTEESTQESTQPGRSKRGKSQPANRRGVD